MLLDLSSSPECYIFTRLYQQKGNILNIVSAFYKQSTFVTFIKFILVSVKQFFLLYLICKTCKTTSLAIKLRRIVTDPEKPIRTLLMRLGLSNESLCKCHRKRRRRIVNTIADTADWFDNKCLSAAGIQVYTDSEIGDHIYGLMIVLFGCII